MLKAEDRWTPTQKVLRNDIGEYTFKCKGSALKMSEVKPSLMEFLLPYKLI